MPVLAFPGPTAPAPPTLQIDVPEGWRPVPADTDLLATEGPGSGSEAVEITVRRHTRHAGYAAEQLADEVAAAGLGDRPGAEVEAPFVVELGGREWLGRNVSWEGPEGSVVEVHLVTPAPGACEVAQFVAATGVVRGDAIDADYDTLQTVLETLTLTGAEQ